MTMNQPDHPPSVPPALTELRALRSDLALVKKELVELRVELKNRKFPDISGQVAKGVILAGLFGGAVWFLLSILLLGLVGR
jgi:hypothetical protein